MPDQQNLEPLTAVGLFDDALTGLKLPPREGRTLDEWHDALADGTVKHYAATAIAACRRADFSVCRHWLQQAEQAQGAYLERLRRERGF